jgi:hypothetical protein
MLLELIILEWLLFAGPEHLTTKIEFVEKSSSYHGYCYHGSRTIHINPEHWDSIPYVWKRELIFHELGHCEFNLLHEPMNKVAIMRPKVYSTDVLGTNWEQLLDSLQFTINYKE